jgi:hypothetical protein
MSYFTERNNSTTLLDITIKINWLIKIFYSFVIVMEKLPLIYQELIKLTRTNVKKLLIISLKNCSSKSEILKWLSRVYTYVESKKLTLVTFVSPSKLS